MQLDTEDPRCRYHRDLPSLRFHGVCDTCPLPGIARGQRAEEITSDLLAMPFYFINNGKVVSRSYEATDTSSKTTPYFGMTWSSTSSHTFCTIGVAVKIFTRPVGEG